MRRSKACRTVRSGHQTLAGVDECQGEPAGRRPPGERFCEEQLARRAPCASATAARKMCVGVFGPEPVREVLPHLGAGADAGLLAARGALRRRIADFGPRTSTRRATGSPRASSRFTDAERSPRPCSRETAPAVRTGYRQNPDEYLLRRLPPPHPVRRGRPRRPRGRTGEKGQRRTVAKTPSRSTT